MEISLLKALLNNILSSIDNLSSDLVQKYCEKAKEILKLLKLIPDANIDSEIASDEVLMKAFNELGQYVDELRELFENWQPFSSKVYFVLQIESLISKIRALGLDIFQLLKSSHEHLSNAISSSALEHYAQHLKQVECEQTSSIVRVAIRDQVGGIGPSSETMVKITESLSLRFNHEILIEAVALEKLKDNAEQAETPREAELFDQMISLVTCMHNHLILVKQSQSCSPVPIPTDFCCPLSLELMRDPVIVASGQTYERPFIKNWIELGLTVCPKTRQTLAHTNLIPNYTVKALIANWCESNNVKLPDPVMPASFSRPSPPTFQAESGTHRCSHVFPLSRANQPTSSETVRSTDSSGRKWISSSGVHRDGTSLHHPRSISESSLPGVLGSEQVLTLERISLTSSEERFADLEERNVESAVCYSVSPSGEEDPNAIIANEKVAQSHSRNASSSSINTSVIYSQGEQGGDSNESSEMLINHLPSYSRDASGEIKAEIQASAASNSPRSHRESEFSPRVIEKRSRNHTIWCRPSDRLVPRIVSSPAMETRADISGVETQVRKLVENLQSDAIDTQRAAAAELRQLAKHSMDNRIVIANCGAINILVRLLRSTDAKIQEDSVTALLNLSINDNNKAAIANADAIEPLIHVLETGSPEAKENSAATLFSLSLIEDNKVRIGRSGAIGPLVDLLGNGTSRGRKDAATALFNLSIFHENKARIVQAGAVKHLVEMMDPAAGMVDKAVAVLANLATIPEGRTAIGQESGIPVLVEVVELGSARGKENAAAALLQLCINSSRFCNVVLQEGAVPPLVALSQSGTPRAKEKAQSLLSFFRNQRHNTARG